MTTGSAPDTTSITTTTTTVAGAGGIELVIDRCGPAGGPGVLLLHGGGQNRHAWKGTAVNLAGAGFDVVAADARGHGDSAWSPEAAYDMSDMADDLEHLLALFDRPPVAVGASMGGISALTLQGRTDTQRYRGLVLVDVTPRMEVAGVERIVSFMAARPDGFESLEEAAEVIAAYNPHRERTGNVDGLRKVLRERDGRWMWRWDPQFILSKAADMLSGNGTANRMQKMADDLHAAAARVTVPALLVRGQQSDLVSEDTVKEFLAEVPHAEYVDVSGTGHMVAGDDNDAFTAAVLDFLERLPDPS
jgi:pimeloyl-ACP methyl ester carboxylesterase